MKMQQVIFLITGVPMEVLVIVMLVIFVDFVLVQPNIVGLAKRPRRL